MLVTAAGVKGSGRAPACSEMNICIQNQWRHGIKERPTETTKLEFVYTYPFPDLGIRGGIDELHLRNATHAVRLLF